VHLDYEPDRTADAHAHNVRNLRAINDILADQEINIERRCWTRAGSGYAIYDINRDCDEGCCETEGFAHDPGRVRETREVRVRLRVRAQRPLKLDYKYFTYKHLFSRPGKYTAKF